MADLLGPDAFAPTRNEDRAVNRAIARKEQRKADKPGRRSKIKVVPLSKNGTLKRAVLAQAKGVGKALRARVAAQKAAKTAAASKKGRTAATFSKASGSGSLRNRGAVTKAVANATKPTRERKPTDKGVHGKGGQGWG